MEGGMEGRMEGGRTCQRDLGGIAYGRMMMMLVLPRPRRRLASKKGRKWALGEGCACACCPPRRGGAVFGYAGAVVSGLESGA